MKTALQAALRTPGSASGSRVPARAPHAPNRSSRSALRCSISVLCVLALSGCAALLPGGGASQPTATTPQGGSAPAAAPAGPGSAEGRPATRAAPPTRSVAAAHAAPAEDPATIPRVDLTSQILFQLLASEVAAQRGEVGGATATYLSLARQTRDPRLARRATELALAERSLERALQSAQLWRELAPQSPLAAQTLEALWLTTGRLEPAEPLLAQRLARARASGQLAQAYPELLRLLMRAPDRSAVLALFDRLAAADQDLPEARLTAAALAERASDEERAAREAAAALALRPDDPETAVAAARFAQRASGGVPAAAALLDDFLRRRPDALEARYAYARLLAAQGRNADARAQMELALKQEPKSPAILFALAQLAYQTRQPDAAEDYLRRYLALPDGVPRDRNPAWVFLAQIEEDRDRNAKAIDWLAKVTPGEQYLPARMRRALLTARLGRLDEARELLHTTSATSARERAQLVSAEAQLLREAGRHADAFEVIDQALQANPDNADLLYDHAMAAERIDRIDQTERSLRRLIELRPDNAHAYNALGYTFADRNLRLDEAKALIDKALQLAPDDPHIIDSLGWVLYRLGRLDEALAQLQRAWEIRPEAEIGVHLGEVLWRLGRADDARRIWLEARKLEPASETLRKTLVRLDVAL